MPTMGARRENEAWEAGPAQVTLASLGFRFRVSEEKGDAALDSTPTHSGKKRRVWSSASSHVSSGRGGAGRPGGGASAGLRGPPCSRPCTSDLLVFCCLHSPWSYDFLRSITSCLVLSPSPHRLDSQAACQS